MGEGCCWAPLVSASCCNWIVIWRDTVAERGEPAVLVHQPRFRAARFHLVPVLGSTHVSRRAATLSPLYTASRSAGEPSLVTVKASALSTRVRAGGLASSQHQFGRAPAFESEGDTRQEHAPRRPLPPPGDKRITESQLGSRSCLTDLRLPACPENLARRRASRPWWRSLSLLPRFTGRTTAQLPRKTQESCCVFLEICRGPF